MHVFGSQTRFVADVQAVVSFSVAEQADRHGVQVLPSTNSPLPHDVHEDPRELPAFEIFPGGQSEQCVLLIDVSVPSVSCSVYFPASQSVQLLLPAVETFPSAQFVQLLPVENVPASQDVQISAPSEVQSAPVAATPLGQLQTLTRQIHLFAVVQGYVD